MLSGERKETMREIKFRAWGRLGKRYVDLEGWAYLEPRGLNETINELTEEGLVLQQYTGLKDKNGKEIYEGDIVCRTVSDNSTRYGQKTNHRVGFYGGSFTMDVPVFPASTAPIALSYYLHEIEVVGNIYENGNLLDGK
jgi:uncharacterized phage protein (TIGR01671 family)